jgi:DNA ligase-1
MRVRDDKGIEEASSPEFLAGLWHAQENRGRAKKSEGGADEGDLVDYDPEEEDIEEEEGYSGDENEV